jgi:hypothetical protein
MEYITRSHNRCFIPSININPRLSARAPTILGVIFVGTSCNIFVLSIYSPYLNNVFEAIPAVNASKCNNLNILRYDVLFILRLINIFYSYS